MENENTNHTTWASIEITQANHTLQRHNTGRLGKLLNDVYRRGANAPAWLTIGNDVRALQSMMATKQQGTCILLSEASKNGRQSHAALPPPLPSAKRVVTGHVCAT
jgi:siroheme synthase